MILESISMRSSNMHMPSELAVHSKACLELAFHHSSILGKDGKQTNSQNSRSFA